MRDAITCQIHCDSALVRQDKNRWWRHPDRTVDVAVAPLPISDKLDVMHVPTSMFLTREHFGTRIGLGDEVFITGLFVPTAGEGPNTPIVRAGNLAMVPRFRVRFRGEDVDVMLIEVRSLGGLSGSPVFARETLHLPGVTHDNKTSFLTGSSRDFHLIGLTSGHWDVDERELNAPYAEVKNKCDPHGVNMGIAVVVPASKILEVLEHSDLKEQRRVELPPPTSHAAAD